jgi:endonuclease YncB( thermonuclease family)
MIKRVNRLAVFTVSAIFFTGFSAAPASAVVSRVVDGDTITLNTGEKVRLLQIDTPELASSECYGLQARAALASLLNSRALITLREDPKLDKVDRYGRSLRYVFVGNTNINLRMVEMGAAAPYFYRGEKGLYSAQFLKAAQRAKTSNRGLWKACPGTALTPSRAVTTSVVANTSSFTGNSTNSNCDGNYAGCIPVFSSDVDCSDIKRLGLAPVRVVGRDIHRLDRDGDGIGCDK